MEKLCVFCKYISMDTSGNFGDYPDPVTFECVKRHWKGIEDFDGKFREQILVAETCKDYSPPKDK